MSWDIELKRITTQNPKLKVLCFEDNLFFKLLHIDSFSFINCIFIKRNLTHSESGAEILCHEFQHVLDINKYHILFFISYLILPIGPSFKAFWEYRAFKENLKFIKRYEFVSKDKRTRNLKYEVKEYFEKITIEWISCQFCNISHFWMWPFKESLKKTFKKLQ